MKREGLITIPWVLHTYTENGTNVEVSTTECRHDEEKLNYTSWNRSQYRLGLLQTPETFSNCCENQFRLTWHSPPSTQAQCTVTLFLSRNQKYNHLFFTTLGFSVQQLKCWLSSNNAKAVFLEAVAVIWSITSMVCEAWGACSHGGVGQTWTHTHTQAGIYKGSFLCLTGQ